MSYSKPLYKDMNKSELLAMRDQGMNNQEIADSLGVCYQTVLRMIGKQPKEVRRNSARGGATVKPDFLEKKLNIPEEPVSACLAVEKSDLYLTGAVARYKLDGERAFIYISNDDDGVVDSTDLKMKKEELLKDIDWSIAVVTEGDVIVNENDKRLIWTSYSAFTADGGYVSGFDLDRDPGTYYFEFKYNQYSTCPIAYVIK